VVVLDEDARAEIEAVVAGAAREHGGLLEHAEARRGLAGVDDLGAGAGDRLGVALGERRDAGQPLHEVERRSARRRAR